MDFRQKRCSNSDGRRTSADEDVVFGTFDHHLWEAAVAEGMVPLPDDLPGLLEEWRS